MLSHLCLRPWSWFWKSLNSPLCLLYFACWLCPSHLLHWYWVPSLPPSLETGFYRLLKYSFFLTFYIFYMFHRWFKVWPPLIVWAVSLDSDEEPEIDSVVLPPSSEPVALRQFICSLTAFSNSYPWPAFPPFQSSQNTGWQIVYIW